MTTKLVSSLYDMASKSNGVVSHHAIQKGIGSFGSYPDRELLIAIQTKPGVEASLFPYFIEQTYTPEQIALLSCVPNSLRHIRNDGDLRKVLFEFVQPPLKTGTDAFHHVSSPDYMDGTTSFGYWIHRYLMRRSVGDVTPNIVVYANHAWPELQLFALDQQ